MACMALYTGIWALMLAAHHIGWWLLLPFLPFIGLAVILSPGRRDD